MTYATTCTGIGIADIALNSCGWDLQWQCEFDQVLAGWLRHYFGKPVYPDLRTIIGEKPPRVGTLVGTIPCQPYATPGRQLGDSDPRALRFHFFQLVRFLNPDWVIIENVTGKWRMEAEKLVRSDLASIGYESAPFGIPSCSVGGWSPRDRTITIAHSAGVRLSGPWRRFEPVYSTEDSDREASGFINAFQGNTLPFLCSSHSRHSKRICERVNHALGNALDPRIFQVIGQAINQIEAQ